VKKPTTWPQQYAALSLYTVLTVALLVQCCVRLSSVVVCIVAKWRVLEQKLLLRAYRKSYMRNRLVPKWMILTFV